MPNSLVIYVGNGHVRDITCLNCGAVNNEVKCNHCGWEPDGAMPEVHVEYKVNNDVNKVDDVIDVIDVIDDDDDLPF